MLVRQLSVRYQQTWTTFRKYKKCTGIWLNNFFFVFLFIVCVFWTFCCHNGQWVYSLESFGGSLLALGIVQTMEYRLCFNESVHPNNNYLKKKKFSPLLVLSCRWLHPPPSQINGAKWNLICGAHSININETVSSLRRIIHTLLWTVFIGTTI